jgi:hypothetical protein
MRTMTIVALVMLVASLTRHGVVEVAGQSAQAQLGLTVSDSLPLPAGEVRGLAWLDLDRLVVLSVIPDSLSPSGTMQVPLTYQDRWGNVTRVEDFTGTLSRGLAFDGKYLWSCGDEQDGGSLLYKIEADTCFIADAFPTPGHRPYGTAWDGTYVWIVDRDSGRLDRFDPESEQVTRSVLAPGFSPCSVAHDGRYTWVGDSGTGRLYRLSGPRGRWNGTVLAEALAFRGRDIVLSSHEGALWFAYVGEDHAYRVVFP